MLKGKKSNAGCFIFTILQAKTDVMIMYHLTEIKLLAIPI